MRPPSKTALIAAARAWDVVGLQNLLAAAPDLVKALDPRGRSPLHLACAVKRAEPSPADPFGLQTANTLLDAGAALEAAVPMDPDEGDFRATPLWYAVARGENFPLAQALLARGADASSCLWAAVWRDDTTLLRTLLATKPKLNLRARGETPLFYAARLQRLRTLPLLLEAGADPTIPDAKGRDPLTIAKLRRLPDHIIESLAPA